MSHKPDRPPDRVEVRGSLSLHVSDPRRPISITADTWNVVFTGNTFRATHLGSVSDVEARSAVATLMTPIANQLSFVHDVAVSFNVDSYAADWVREDRRDVKTAECVSPPQDGAFVFRSGRSEEHT